MKERPISCMKFETDRLADTGGCVHVGGELDPAWVGGQPDRGGIRRPPGSEAGILGIHQGRLSYHDHLPGIGHDLVADIHLVKRILTAMETLLSCDKKACV